ncbi:MAG: hypothetical protein CMJ81_16425 [Planctomycetaceae bacterium]|nr:hypothetical protein [Planctomycetaceae bacterium]MBP64032.1 hypothetical protein [Planctomycetaceae bacterium]
MIRKRRYQGSHHGDHPVFRVAPTSPPDITTKVLAGQQQAYADRFDSDSSDVATGAVWHWVGDKAAIRGVFWKLERPYQEWSP